MKILVAEDDKISRKLIEGTLSKWSHEVVLCADGSDAMDVLREKDAPQLAILDWMMPGMTGPEVCREVRQNGQEPYTYILLLTSRDSREDLLEGMDAGADDYLTKPFDQSELMVRLNAGRRILDLQTQLINMREELRIQATADGLTGLWNQTEIRRILSTELRRAERHDAPVAVLFFDIDHFKLVNDTWGHAIGDTVLVEIANRMRQTLRDYDTFGRFGGEEFMVVLPDCDDAEAVDVAERLRQSIAGTPISGKKGEIDVTISIGVTSNVACDNADAEVLIRAADAAMYRAKRAGRNCVKQATPADSGKQTIPVSASSHQADPQRQ